MCDLPCTKLNAFSWNGCLISYSCQTVVLFVVVAHSRYPLVHFIFIAFISRPNLVVFFRLESGSCYFRL
jgi:hypothetical protein